VPAGRGVGVLAEASGPAAAVAAAAAATSAVRNAVRNEGSGRAEQADRCHSCGTEDTEQEPPKTQQLPREREAILENSGELEIETAAAPYRIEGGGSRQAEGVGKGGAGVDGGDISPGDQQPSGGSGASGAGLPWAAVLALSGWKVDEIEALLRVRQCRLVA